MPFPPTGLDVVKRKLLQQSFKPAEATFGDRFFGHIEMDESGITFRGKHGYLHAVDVKQQLP